jgi:alkanesulfonate monooxygenase SsuD/methylene tetrahydromethanopterin reductase-like flavin-dependent oxidoreductase (luciferase family)
MGLRAVEVAAQVADGVILMLPTLEYLKDVTTKIATTIASRKKVQGRFHVACHFITAVSNDPRVAELSAKRAVARYAAIPVYRESFRRLGFNDEVFGIEKAIREKGKGDVARVVPRSMTDALTVYGSPEECWEKLHRYAAMGVTEPVIYPYIPSPEGSQRAIDDTIRMMTPGRQR